MRHPVCELRQNAADFAALSECRFEHSANIPLIVDSQDLPVYRHAQYQSLTECHRNRKSRSILRNHLFHSTFSLLIRQRSNHHEKFWTDESCSSRNDFWNTRVSKCTMLWQRQVHTGLLHTGLLHTGLLHTRLLPGYLHTNPCRSCERLQQLRSCGDSCFELR